MSRPAPVRIVGIGSAHGADRVGWQAIDEIGRRGLVQRLPPGVVSLHRCAVPAQLVNLLEGCRLALLLDAVAAEPGALLRLRPGELEAGGTTLSAHGLGVRESLQLLSALAAEPPQVRIIGIGIGDPPGELPPGFDYEALERLVETELASFHQLA